MNPLALIPKIISQISGFYRTVECVKNNKQRCKQLEEKVRGLERLVLIIKERRSGEISSTVTQILREISVTLGSATHLVTKFTNDSSVKRFLKSGKHEDKLCMMNEKLSDHFQMLSGAVQVEHSNKLDEIYRSVKHLDRAGPVRPSPKTPLPLPSPMPPMLPFLPMAPPTPALSDGFFMPPMPVCDPFSFSDWPLSFPGLVSPPVLSSHSISTNVLMVFDDDLSNDFDDLCLW